MRRPAAALLASALLYAGPPALAQTAAPSAAPAVPVATAAPPAVAGSAPAPAVTSVADAVDAAAARLLAGKHVPGFAIAVASRGAAPFVRGYGFADVAKKTPVTPDTAFEIGSVTKQFTAACILQLAEAGKLSLDDRVGTYVPEYFVGRGVTVRQLLAQTSGIPDYLGAIDSLAEAARLATFDQVLARISARPLAFAPGTTWAYSNTNYLILGHIVQMVAHEPYAAYVREHLFAPAGMTHSGFIADEAKIPVMARGYASTLGGTAPAPVLDDSWAGGAGSIVSTAGDLLAWDAALDAGTVLKPADVALMRTGGTLHDGTPTHYGFGWLVDAVAGHPRTWHNGGTFGFHAVNVLYPADGEAIVILGNATTGLEATAAEIFERTHADVAAAAAAATASAADEKPAVTARVRDWLHRFQTADVDRAQLDATMSRALTPALVDATKAQLAPLGDPLTLAYRGSFAAGDATVYRYRATFATTSLDIVMTVDASGKISGYRLLPP